MTRQMNLRTVVVTSMLAIGLSWTAARLHAEPIAGEEAAAGAAAESPESKEAVSLFNKHDFPGALKQLKLVTAKDADLPPANVIMARWCSDANASQLVRNYLEQAVMESPEDPEVYLIMGEIALNDRRWTDAELLLAKCESLLPKFDKSEKRKTAMQPRVFSGLTMVAEARDAWPAAQKQLEAWLKLDPKNAAAMQRLANSLFQQKNPDAALEKLKEAVKANKQALTAEAMLAQYYEKAGDRENAKKWMIAALTAAPKDLNTRLVAARWALDTSQFADAERQAAAALELDPKSARAKVLLGEVALFKADYPAAERYFEMVHLDSPGDFAASNNLALALIEQKDEAKKKRAMEYAENNIRQYPKAVEATSTYGWVLYKMGKIEEAEKALQAAIQNPNVGPDTAYYLAKIYVERGRDAQAKELLEIAVQSPKPFTMRQNAQELLEKLKK